MASPTRWLRKNSKIIMVFVAVFAMAIFGLGPVVDQMAGGGRSRGQQENEVVATWRGGKITQADIATWYRKHYQMQNFLRAVSDIGRARAGDDFKPLAPMLPPLQSGDRAPQSMVNIELIQKFLLAQAAKEEGFLVGDGVIDAYIDMISGSAGLSRNDLMQINRETNQRVSLESIYAQLKMELAAQQMRTFSMAGFQQIPNPTEAAELYQKYTEAIELEIYPLPIEKFLGQVATPPPASELKSLFEQGQHEFADPTGKRPGFKKPNELAIQYVTADFDTVLTNLMNRLTDEEVQLEYERLVEEKSSLVVQRIPKPQPGAQPEGDSDDEAPVLPGESEAEDEGLKQDLNNETTTDQVDSTEKVDSTEGDNQKKADPNQTGESQSGENNTNDLVCHTLTEIGRSVAMQNSMDQIDVTNIDGSGSAVQFVSFHQDEKSESQVQTESTTGTETETNVQEDDNVDQDENSNLDLVLPGNQTAPLNQDLEALLEQIRASQGDSLFADDQQFEERILPLVEVVDRVKRSMVEDQARVDISEKMERVVTELIDFNVQISVWESLENQQAVEKPTMDVRALATRFDLVYDEIPLADLEALQKTDFGQISFSFRDEMGRFQFTTLAELIFFQFDQKKEFDPEQADDMLTGNSYVFWITEKKPAEVLSFEQAKNQVEEFWRRQRAIDLALKDAENKAEEANRQGKWLSEIFGDNASRTGEFTWLSLAGGGRFGAPFGVESPGEEFMESAFSLEPKKAGFALNGNRDIAYVIQMVGERRTVEELGKDFINNRLMTAKEIPFETQRAAGMYIQETYFDWDRNLRDRMGLRLVR